MVDSPLGGAHLCPILQGVEASLVAAGRVVRVIVPAELLQHVFGATFEPESWLSTFDSNSALIEAAALRAHASDGKSTIVLRQI